MRVVYLDVIKRVVRKIPLVNVVIIISIVVLDCAVRLPSNSRRVLNTIFSAKICRNKNDVVSFVKKKYMDRNGIGAIVGRIIFMKVFRIAIGSLVRLPLVDAGIMFVRPNESMLDVAGRMLIIKV